MFIKVFFYIIAVKRRIKKVVDLIILETLLRVQKRNIKSKFKEISQKDTLSIGFFVLHKNVCQYESLYHKMLNDHNFNPIIIIVPYTKYENENMLSDMNKAYS